jgi:aspartate ammonia-lyase
MASRVKHDLLGVRAVPANAYYGIHTLRAVSTRSWTVPVGSRDL